MSTIPARWPSVDDLSFGTGAAPFEKALSYLGGLAVAGFVAWQYFAGGLDWPAWKLLLALVIALDVGAGAVANVLETCGRFYHAGPLPEDPWLVRKLKDPFFFAAIHIYPILIGLIYGPGSWVYGLVGYGLMLLASWVVIRAPARYQRPIAYFVTVLVMVYSPSLLAAPPGFDWLLPVLFLKIVAGHSVTWNSN